MRCGCHGTWVRFEFLDNLVPMGYESPCDLISETMCIQCDPAS